MSAALLLPTLDAAAHSTIQPQLLAQAVRHIQRRLPSQDPGPAESMTPESGSEPSTPESVASGAEQSQPCIHWAFYRRHTERLLQRYLYASLQVGRSPALLGESVGQGWVSSRPVHTFEDALIFVLDIERCLKRLPALDRQIISRILIQQYTYAEAATLLGLSARTLITKLPQAIDRLTESLVSSDLLMID